MSKKPATCVTIQELRELCTGLIQRNARHRGFYYATECAQILTNDHDCEVPDTLIHAATAHGQLKMDTSPPSKVVEIDLDSFEQYRASYHPRPYLRGPRPHLCGPRGPRNKQREEPA